MTEPITIGLVAIAFVAGSIMTGAIAFADDDDDDDHGKKEKTFEEICAKKLDKKKLNLDGFFCQVINAIQVAIADLDARVIALEESNESGNSQTTYSRSSSVAISSEGFETTSVSCDDGDIATGGGVHSDQKDIHTVSSAPTGNDPPTGWIGSANNAAFGPGAMTVYVVCIGK